MNCVSETHPCVILFLIYVDRIGARPFSVGEMRADLEPSVSASAVKMTPGAISVQHFHCINTCGVTITETAPNCVEMHYKDSRQHHVSFQQLYLVISRLF